MHCTSCGLLIDDELEDVDGVRAATTGVRTGRSAVQLDDSAVLVTAVEAAGDYTARVAV